MTEPPQARHLPLRRPRCWPQLILDWTLQPRQLRAALNGKTRGVCDEAGEGCRVSFLALVFETIDEDLGDGEKVFFRTCRDELTNLARYSGLCTLTVRMRVTERFHNVAAKIAHIAR